MDNRSRYDVFLSDLKNRLESKPNDIYLIALPTEPSGHAKDFSDSLRGAVVIANRGKKPGKEVEIFFYRKEDGQLWKWVAGS
jgi:hypothetical protein